MTAFRSWPKTTPTLRCRLTEPRAPNSTCTSTPARDAEHFYQLKEGEKLEILKRATADKNAKESCCSAEAKAAKATAASAAKSTSGPASGSQAGGDIAAPVQAGPQERGFGG